MSSCINYNNENEQIITVGKNCKKQDYNYKSESESEIEEEIEEGIEPKPTLKKIFDKKSENSKPNAKFNRYDDNNFCQKLGQYTFGLDKVIPWEDSNFVFTGGLLHNILNDRFSTDLSDIDLFFYGDSESKHKTINKLLDNLDKEQYYYLIGYLGSVIYIFIQGIPRIIQLIMTNKNSPEPIVNSFDMTHIMLYSDGTQIFGTDEAIKNLKSNTTRPININPNRIIKYYERGIKFDNIFNNSHLYVLDSEDTTKIIKNKKQIKLYQQTMNLTKLPNELACQVDFTNFPKDKIDLHDYFGCKINYDKLNNHEFKEGVNMFGAFTDYLNIKPSDIINTEDFKDKSDKHFVNYSITKLKYTHQYQNGCIHCFNNEESLYLYGKFIKFEDIELNNFNDHKKIYFEIDNDNIIEYLTNRINKYIILQNMTFNSSNNKKLIESKFKLSESKIFLPFENSSKFKDLNPNSSNEFANRQNLVICCKLYQSEYEQFKLLNVSNLLDNLEPDENVNCLFNFNIYIRYTNDKKESIEYIDINLSPVYIQRESK